MAESTTVDWVCATHPARVKALFEALALDRDGLSNVKAAVARGDNLAACQALLGYYRTCDSGKWLRWEKLPPPGKARDETADAMLDDTFTFYGQTDRVPRRPDGGLVWSHKGPKGDIEWAYELNRDSPLRDLLTAYRKTGNVSYAARLDELVRDWVCATARNPNTDAGPMWRGLEVSFRAKYWAQVFYALQQDERFTPAARLLMLATLPQHAHQLKTGHGGGNWMTMELSGLAAIAAAFPEFRESQQNVAYAIRRLNEDLAVQVYPDGAQVELTSHYHGVALSNFEQLSDICRSAEIPLPAAYAVGLEKMWHYLAAAMRPDGHGPLNGDSDLDYHRDTVLTAAETYQRPDWTYIASSGAKGKKPEYGPSVLFPWAGQLVIRSGWDTNALWAFFDVGAGGGWHGHHDKLHLSVAAGGRDLLVDSGRFTYSGTNERFRSQYAVLSRAHNVIILDGKGQREGPKRTQKPIAEDHYLISPEMTFARGSCDFFDGIAGQAVHTRAVVYLQGKLIVVADRIETDRARKIEALWHWHPRCTVKVDDGTVVSTDIDAGNLRIVPVAGFNWTTKLVKGQEKPDLQGWYSRSYNVFEPNSTAVLTAEVAGSTAFAWLLLPARGKPESVRGQIIENTADTIRLRIQMPRGKALTLRIPWRTGPAVVEEER